MALLSPWGYDGLTYDGQEMRYLAEALSGGGAGVSEANDYAPTPQGTPNNTIRLAAGTAVIPATFAGDLGSYVVPNDASLTSPAFAATGGNPRWDYLILRVVAGVPELHIVQGTASGSPSYPSLAGLTNYIVICGVKMPASASIIDNGSNGVIDDLRELWNVTLNTVTGLLDDALPWLIDVDTFMSAVSQVNWNTLVVDTVNSALYQGWRSSSGAQNDEVSFDVVLNAGTWTFEMMHPKYFSQGIVTVTVGAISAGTIDQYHATGQSNVRSSLTGIVIPTTGKYRVKLKMSTKNASATAYTGAVQHIQLRRTA